MNQNQVIIVAIICMTIIFIASTVSPAGYSGKAGAGFQVETVNTGDVIRYGNAIDETLIENEFFGRVVRHA